MSEAAVEILIVEDNPNDLELTLRALKRSNVANHVVSIDDGEEALDFLFARGRYGDRKTDDTPRVVFLDLKLPKVDGIEILRAMRSDPRTRMIPVVIITSSAEERDRAATYAIGANSFVVKPIDSEAFTKTMAEVGFYWLAINRSPLSL
jgi:two-component system response regulator